MKALQLEKPLQFRRIELPAPPPPGATEARVRVHRVGICGTDISGYLGKMPFFSYPRIPGHELGVEVLAVGSDVAQVQPGDRCSIEPYINCQNCSSCHRGNSNCCENHQTLGVHSDGGLRPEFIIPARKLHVSTRLSYEQLALVETLAIGCHAINRAKVQPGESVLVIGAGPIGLSIIEFAKQAGANTIVMDLNEARLRFCQEKMGVRHVLTPPSTEADVERLKACTADKSWPIVVLDATGSHKSMSQALNYCGFAGRLVFVGITQQELAFPHAPILHRRELSLLASRNALPDDFRRIIKLIEEGAINTEPWITHRLGFDEVPAMFPAFTRPETGVIKAIIDVGV
jgi:2-desacetyl-2-hydroxyethyl bacteriochlorophyllide A dehydrogenase